MSKERKRIKKTNVVRVRRIPVRGTSQYSREDAAVLVREIQQQMAFDQWKAKDPYDREITDGVTYAGETHKVPTYRDLLTTYLNRSGCENVLKIPKGTIFRFPGHNPIILKQSLIFDKNRGIWFVEKPHTSRDKANRRCSLQDRGALLSFLAPINLDDPASFKGLHYTQIKKTVVVPANATPEQVQDILDKQQRIAALTTRFSGAASDCFVRQGISEELSSPIIKVETVTDFIPGEDLITFLETRRPDLLTTVKIVIAMLEALKLVQQEDVVHCDIKPEHFIITEEGGSFKVKIIDWEFACKAGNKNRSGTLKFVDPEVLMYGDGGRQIASDTFSMGVVISCLLLRSKTPFELRAEKLTKICKQLRMTDSRNFLYPILMEKYGESMSSIPTLSYDASIGIMQKIFPELKGLDTAFVDKLKPILGDMLDVINSLIQLDASKRIDLDTALLRFQAIDEKLRVLLSPQYQEQSQSYSQQSQQPAAAAATSVTVMAVAAAAVPAAVMREEGTSAAGVELFMSGKGAEKENRYENVAADVLFSGTQMDVVKSSKVADPKQAASFIYGQGGAEIDSDAEADEEVAKLTSELEERLKLVESARVTRAAEAISFAPQPKLAISTMLLNPAAFFGLSEQPLPKRPCQRPTLNPMQISEQTSTP